MPTLNLVNHLKSDRWLLLAMLAPLHGMMLLVMVSRWVYPLLIIHLVLFQLWQWRKQRKVVCSICIILVGVMALFWLDWWAIAFWLFSLSGLVGARSFALRDRWARTVHISATVYLCTALLLWVTPNLFSDLAAIETGHLLMWYIVPALLLSLPLLNMLMQTVFPVSNNPDAGAMVSPERLAIKDSHITDKTPTPGHSNLNENLACIEDIQTVNFIYSLLLFMLLALLMLGCLAFMTLARLGYHEALLRTLLLAGLVWLALIVLSNPHFGFSGLQLIFSRYLHNAGTPFESWFTRLAEAAQHEPDPAFYLLSATRLLTDLPWLSGLSWQSPDGTGQLGQFSKHEVQVKEGELRLTIYARKSLNPAVLLHIHQLAQLVGYFYQAKQREQSLRNIAHLQAVYETGSRLTHDLKNMLQSLLCITDLAQSREQRAQQLLQQQLPMLAQRIESTLNKLQQPQSESATPQLSLTAWWDALRMRNRHQIIEWHAPDVLPDQPVPATLFDCALDNLLDNALRKRQFQSGIRITVALCAEPVSLNTSYLIQPSTTGGHILRLSVCDSGDQIPETVAANLLRSVVFSEHGLGIGVYQTARWAEQLGYRLTLKSNQTGKVCFELRG